MAKVRVVNVTKVYAHGVKAIDDVDLEIHDREFIVLVGPSGSGKSTILRMIAGLEEVTGGEIYIDGRMVNDVLPKDRDIAMVFQDYALYPHMTVFDNIAFGLKMRKFPRSDIHRRVTDTARMLGIQGLLQRKPKQISGGERQRVALGRAIVRNPKVFLMDEPLSNLDAKLRVQMRLEIHRLHRNMSATVIYVTHDQTEAMTMGTRIVVLKDGVVQQVDTPREIYTNPANTFVASFIGTPPMNLLHGHLTREDGQIRISWPEGFLRFPQGKGERAIAAGYPGSEIIVGIRPEHVHLASGNEPDGCCVKGEVDVVENMGAECCASIAATCGSLMMKVPSETRMLQGEQVCLDFDAGRVHLFDAASGKRVV